MVLLRILPWARIQTFLSPTLFCEYILYLDSLSLCILQTANPAFCASQELCRLRVRLFIFFKLRLMKFFSRKKPILISPPEHAEESGSGMRSDQSDAEVEDRLYVVWKSFDIMQINHRPSPESPQLEAAASSPEALRDDEVDMFLVTSPVFQDPLLAKYGIYENLPFIE